MTGARLKSPIIWRGGKHYTRKHLYQYLEDVPHQTFVDVFGGGGSVVLGKKPAPVDVYNDIHGGVVNLFRILRDEQNAAELRRLLELTPYSREEFHTCRDGWRDEADEVEKARMFFVTCRQSFSGDQSSWGFAMSWSARGMAALNSSFLSAIDALPAVTERLRRVQIENAGFERMFEIYDRPETLFYCDPPYMHGTRRRNSDYTHEMTDADHVRLLDTIQRAAGVVVLSGYDNDLYNDTLRDWRKAEFDVASFTSKAVNGKRADDRRTEALWLSPNHPAARQLELS